MKALKSTDVFFILDKGEEKADLTDLRREMLRTHLPEGSYRVVAARDPERDRSTDTSGYAPAVDDWRGRRADIYERLIVEELGADETGAFLVWGDPALYDSTIGIVDEVLARGNVAFDHDVIPTGSGVRGTVAAAQHWS